MPKIFKLEFASLGNRIIASYLVHYLNIVIQLVEKRIMPGTNNFMDDFHIRLHNHIAEKIMIFLGQQWWLRSFRNKQQDVWK